MVLAGAKRRPGERGRRAADGVKVGPVQVRQTLNVRRKVKELLSLGTSVMVLQQTLELVHLSSFRFDSSTYALLSNRIEILAVFS